jgi:tRNA1(Val) A37 N6-methylase TrmN6
MYQLSLRTSHGREPYISLARTCQNNLVQLIEMIDQHLPLILNQFVVPQIDNKIQSRIMREKKQNISDVFIYTNVVIHYSQKYKNGNQKQYDRCQKKFKQKCN